MTVFVLMAGAALALPLQGETDFARRLATSRRAEAVAREELKDALARAQGSAGEHRESDLDLTQAEAALRVLERRIAATDNAMRAAVEKTQQMIDFHQRQLDRAEAEGKSETLRVELARAVIGWRQKRDRRLRESGLPEQKARLERLLPAAEEAVRRARASAMTRRDESLAAQRRVEEARSALDKARRDLEDLLKEGDETFRHLAPPHLQEVIVRRAGRLVYDAEWVSRKVDADDRVAVVEAGLRGARAHRAEMQAGVEKWLGTVLEAQAEFNVATDAYVAAIHTSAWKVILVELADAGVTIFRDFKSYGPAAFGVEAVARVGKAVSGHGAREFEDPVTGPATGSSLLGTGLDMLGDKSIKSGVKMIVQSAVTGGKKTRWEHIPAVNWRDWRGWRDAMNNGELQKLVRSQPLWPGSDARLNEWVRGTLNVQPRQLMVSIKARLRSPGTWTKLLTSMGQGAAKEAILRSWADDARLASWRNWMATEQAMVQALRFYKVFSLLSRDADAVIGALHAELEEARKEALAAQGFRRLNTLIDDVLEGDGPFELELRFTREVEVSKVELGGRPVEGAASGARWIGRFRTEGLPESSDLRVDAIDAASRRALDSPATVAYRDVTGERWEGYEEGPDRHHRLKLKPVKPGRSVLFLVDCSGSMEANNRMANAKEAIRRALRSPGLDLDDEFALMAFFRTGDVRLLVPFTRARESIISAANGLAPDGDTPLAPSMRLAGRYLRDGASTTRLILIVLSDGQDTSDEDPQDAARELRRVGVEVRRR